VAGVAASNSYNADGDVTDPGKGTRSLTLDRPDPSGRSAYPYACDPNAVNFSAPNGSFGS
jgi:hypothetical protein